jgi:hypothetical protein
VLRDRADEMAKQILKTSGVEGVNMKDASAVLNSLNTIAEDAQSVVTAAGRKATPEQINRAKAARDLVDQFSEAHFGQGSSAPAAPGGGGVQPPAPIETTEKRYTPAEARKLPPGTIYVGTDGVKRRV